MMAKFVISLNIMIKNEDLHDFCGCWCFSQGDTLINVVKTIPLNVIISYMIKWWHNKLQQGVVL